MKTASLILGIIGGIFGLIGATFALFIGGLGGALEAEGASQIVGLGWFGFLFAILGIVAGAIAIAKPKIAGILMLVAGIGGIISISAAFAPASILLMVAGILALVGSRSKK